MADRTRDPVPDGLELYLAAEDLTGADWLERTIACVRGHTPPGDFAYVVEGPLRSLDGSFFDVTVDSPANREVLERLVQLGRAIGAEAVVIHAIAPRDQVDRLTPEQRKVVLQRATGFLERYAGLCQLHGLVPTIENIPPVAQMREARPSFSLLGTAPEDLDFLCRRVPGLRVTLDVSHAQLYVNAARCHPKDAPAELRPMVRSLRAGCQVANLEEYIDRLGEHLFEAHLSNARGLTGEGLAWHDGELDLAAVVQWLRPRVCFLVAETIEPDPDHAVRMREVQRCLQVAKVA